MEQIKKMTSKEMQRKKKEKYFSDMCFLMKTKDTLLPGTNSAGFNRTELRLINEIVVAQYEGERVISTQLAKRIGVTRSAVSQMVAHLEEEGILRRVPSVKDKKIAYVEITEGAWEKYSDALNETLNILGAAVEELGEDTFQDMCENFRRFVEILHKHAKKEE